MMNASQKAEFYEFIQELNDSINDLCIDCHDYYEDEDTIITQFLDENDYDINTTNDQIIKDIEKFIGEEGLVDVPVKQVKENQKQLENIVKKQLTLKKKELKKKMRIKLKKDF